MLPRAVEALRIQYVYGIVQDSNVSDWPASEIPKVVDIQDMRKLPVFIYVGPFGVARVATKDNWQAT